ncbi:hypothetical protein PV327_011704, partial [Microctonus hyperodae]
GVSSNTNPVTAANPVSPISSTNPVNQANPANPVKVPQINPTISKSTDKIISRGPGGPRKNPFKEPPSKKIFETWQSESTTDKYELIRKKARKDAIIQRHSKHEQIKSESNNESVNDDNDDTSDSDASVYSVEMAINPRILHKKRLQKIHENTNPTSDSESSIYSVEMAINPRTLNRMKLYKEHNSMQATSDSDDTPHFIEKIKNAKETGNHSKHMENIDTKKLHHSPPYSSDSVNKKKIKLINSSDTESTQRDSADDNEHSLAVNIPLPSPYTLSKTETASENEFHNREWPSQTFRGRN